MNKLRNHEQRVGWITRIKSRLKSLLRFQPFRYFRVSRKQWNEQYREGEWEYLCSPEQSAHYAVIAEFVHWYAPDGSVLDVGCGEGILQPTLARYGYSTYVGIDISDAAIRKAEERENAATSFKVSAANEYVPEQQFDAILFNEVLYYFKNPEEIAERYASYLLEDGVIIVSMWKSHGTGRIWNILDSRFTVLQEVELNPGNALARTVKVLRGKGN
ncbi:MAG: class I SAM-dependent methyltransferase [Candidatus Marinimicrobia bacterium]|nr:class I SAM-dependent methyltransferase [Candidatus Neomarinimicrobiota bacterium]MCF7829272.1 class I SAM-dependent methyltransferase [Candidatus Neomarinimicrobiota bacterium]MCF7881075.1 class I SAM-dependent methyltransferase [Candidatus Neomarinimicrobiota bacterium]